MARRTPASQRVLEPMLHLREMVDHWVCMILASPSSACGRHHAYGSKLDTIKPPGDSDHWAKSGDIIHVAASNVVTSERIHLRQR